MFRGPVGDVYIFDVDLIFYKERGRSVVAIWCSSNIPHTIFHNTVLPKIYLPV